MFVKLNIIETIYGIKSAYVYALFRNITNIKGNLNCIAYGLLFITWSNYSENFNRPIFAEK